ncbi:MAG: DEAD/DEAH box helicase family protein [Rhodoferax sp.]|nr:DEAD/DEAH box helicase family protein [Rhodoferax sp.]
MATFIPKKYQQDPANKGGVLDSVEAYFKAIHTHGRASRAFTAVTEDLWDQGLRYSPLKGFAPDMPYFCLRVPTGGGKTWLAAKSLSLVNTHLLRVPHSVVLWLVPSKPIREQTLRGLKDRNHPLNAALREAGPVTVLDLTEAKALTRATLDTSTVVIVATRQAFQVEDEESRKVYESSGALMHHFENLTPAQRQGLLQDGDTVPFSLANVLRLRRPFVVVDEAHNNRTELAFDMLARFNPSGIMELTATPDMERTPSNVLHSVSASQLKAEQMIKLPVVLETEPNWQQCLSDAIARRNGLQKLADDEQRLGAPYLRPIVLIQSEPRREGLDKLDFERVRQELQTNHGIPADEIIVATSDEKGLEKVDADYKLGISDPACPVKFVITQKALAEGWDCPFAYVLVSMASLQSATSVEQLLGRVLRQPGAAHRAAKELNQSYALVVSRSFFETAQALRDRLVEGSGFDRKDVAEFVTAARQEQQIFDPETMGSRVELRPVLVTLHETPDLKALPKDLRSTINDKVDFDRKTSTLTIRAPLTLDEADALKQLVATPLAKAAIEAGAIESRTTAIEFFKTPAEDGKTLLVPQLALRVQGELQLFDDPEVLDYPWALSLFDAKPTPDNLSKLGAALTVSEGGTIDIDEATGKLVQDFMPNLQRDLGLAYVPEHWDSVKLAAWLCTNLPEPSLTHASKLAFVSGWLSDLLSQPGFNLGRANLQKFLMRNLLEARIRELRSEAVKQAYQESLFGEAASERVSVSNEFVYDFRPEAYAPSRDDDGQLGQHRFRKHFYSRIGAFDSKEEFECAAWLDTQAQKGRLQYWVRNLARREGASFFFQKATGRFYPDFVCKLNDDSFLIVEYKGANGWTDAQDDRDIGGLWDKLSGGTCHFVMIKDKQWSGVDPYLSGSPT